MMLGDKRANRRTVLKNIGTGAISATVLSGSASATEEWNPEERGFDPVTITEERQAELMSDYRSLEQNKKVFNELTAPIRDELVDEGYLKTTDIEVLGLYRQSRVSPIPSDAGFRTLHVGTGALEGFEDGFVQMDTKVQSGQFEVLISVNVTAQIAKAWVFDGEDGVYSTKSGAESDDVTSTSWGCSTNSDGENKCWTCNCIYSCGGYYELYCTDGSGYYDCASANTDQKCCYDCDTNNKSGSCCCSWCD